MRLLFTIVAVCLALLLAATAMAEVPPAHQAILLLRTLAYDRSLKARAGAVVTIAVLYKEGDEVSELAQADIATALGEAAAHLQVSGLPVRVVSIPFRNQARLDSALAADHVSAIYLCYGLADDLGTIAAATRQRTVLSLTGAASYVGAGAAIGFVEHDGRAVLLVDLDQVRAQGAQLEAALLRFSQIIKGTNSR